MDGILSRVGLMTSPRSLLALSLMLSVLSAGGGKGTLAYFTSSVVSENLTFSSGYIDVAGSTVPTSASFKWNTSGGGNCKTIQLDTNATDTTAQAMVPGQFCVAPITITNSTPSAGSAHGVDAWMRVRLVRDTTATDATTQALNDRLKFYMHEFASSTARDSACTTTGYAPSSTAAVTGATAAVGKSTQKIQPTGGTPLTSLGDEGKNIGQHPGMFGPADTTASAYFQANTAFSSLSAGVVPTTSQSGLHIVDGANNAVFEGGMNTTRTSARNAFNLIGNDEVTNPRKLTSSTTANGTEGYSTNDEATIAANSSKFYCAAMFFPSDFALGANSFSGVAVNSLTDLNSKGDNAARAASLQYRLVVTAAQKAGRSSNN